MATVAIGNELTPQNICFECRFHFVPHDFELSVDLSRSVTITFDLAADAGGMLLRRRIT